MLWNHFWFTSESASASLSVKAFAQNDIPNSWLGCLIHVNKTWALNLRHCLENFVSKELFSNLKFHPHFLHLHSIHNLMFQITKTAKHSVKHFPGRFTISLLAKSHRSSDKAIRTLLGFPAETLCAVCRLCRCFVIPLSFPVSVYGAVWITEHGTWSEKWSKTLGPDSFQFACAKR